MKSKIIVNFGSIVYTMFIKFWEYKENYMIRLFLIVLFIFLFFGKNEVDYNKVSTLIVRDLRNGYLGKVTFDE